jgi:hypothetical protein
MTRLWSTYHPSQRRYLVSAFRFSILGVVLPVVLAACSLFSTRDPDIPITESGTFIQPDTPEQVVSNIQSAIAELNTLNYRRSFAESLVFRPTASALARTPLLTNWTRVQEEQYFSTLVAASATGSGHNLALNDQSFTIINDTRFVIDATYVLTINHNRPDAETNLQGRLQWVIDQSSDGLWALSEWTDQELGNAASWSDLKAIFIE